MAWYAYVMIALFAVNALVVVYMIDRPREPLTAGDAVVVLIINALLVLGTVGLAT